MAPKAKKGDDKQAKAAAKARAESKKKASEDKTFGLKNKNKSKKVQQYVNTVQKGAASRAAPGTMPGEEAQSRKARKAQETAANKELYGVTVRQPPLAPGVDPKSVLCEYFKVGACEKGARCKFSHDLNVGRKAVKADIFTDRRDIKAEEEDEGMADWDQAELESAIAKKHAGENQNKATEIICKYFLEAVEKKLYGWFWKCPNGDTCMYRHALPPGYVLKSQMKELLEAEAANVVDMADLVEEERAKVDARTPITESVFAEWNRQQKEAKLKSREEAERERRRKGLLNGREIFMEEGFVAQDADGAAGEMLRDDREEEAAIKAMEAAAAAEATAAAEAAGVDLTPEEAALLADDEDLDEDLDDLEAELAKAASLGET